MENNVLEIIIKAKDLASKTIEDVGKTAEKQGNKFAEMSKQFAAAGAVLTGVGVGAGLMIKDWAEKAGEAEAQMAVSNSYLINASKEMGTSFEGLQGIVAETSKKMIQLGFDDEDTSVAFSKLIAITGDTKVAQDALSASLDLARLPGKNLESATKAINLAMQGSPKLLKEFGIEVSDNASKQEVLQAIMGKVGGTAQAYSETYKGAMERMSIQTTNLKEALGEKFLPILSKVATWIGNLVDKVQTMNPNLVKVIAIVTAVVAVFGLVGGPILLLLSMLPLISAGFAMVSASLLPVIAIIAGLAAVAAGVYLVFKNWDKIKDFFAGLWEGITSWISQTWASIGQFFTNMVTGIGEWLNQALASIGKFIVDAILFFALLPVRIFQLYVKLWTEDIPYLIGWLIGWVSEVVPKWIAEFVAWVKDMSIQILLKFWEMVTNIILWLESLWTWLVTSIPVWWAQFIQWVVDMAKKVADLFVQLKTWVIERLTALWAWISTEVPTWPSKFIGWLKSLPSMIANIFEEAKEKAIGLAKGLYDGVKQWLDSVIGWLKDVWDWGNKAAGAVANAFSKGKESGAVQGARADGGWINNTGLYLMHQGEYVMSNAMLRGNQRSEITTNNNTPTVNVYATVNDDVDIQKLAYSLAYELRNK